MCQFTDIFPRRRCLLRHESTFFYADASLRQLALISTAMGIYGPHLCKGLIDAVWCDNVGSQTHSNSANMLYILYTKEDMLCLLLLVFV